MVKLNCKKSDVIVNSRTSGITLDAPLENGNVLFFQKLLEKLHEVTLSK